MANQRSSLIAGASESNNTPSSLPLAVNQFIVENDGRRKGVAELHQFVQFQLTDLQRELKIVLDEYDNPYKVVDSVREQISAESAEYLRKTFVEEKSAGVNYNNLVNGAQKIIFDRKDALYLKCFVYIRQQQGEKLAGQDLYVSVRDLHEQITKGSKKDLRPEIEKIDLAQHEDDVNKFIKAVLDDYLKIKDASAKIIFQKHVAILWQKYQEEKVDPIAKNILGGVLIKVWEKYPAFMVGFAVDIKIQNDKQLKADLKKLSGQGIDPAELKQVQEVVQHVSDNNVLEYIKIQIFVKLLLDAYTLMKNYKATTAEEKEVLADSIKPALDSAAKQLTVQNINQVTENVAVQLEIAMSKLTYSSKLRNQLHAVLVNNCMYLVNKVQQEMKEVPGYKKDQWESVARWAVELREPAPFRMRHAIDAVIDEGKKEGNEQLRGNAAPVLALIDELLKLPKKYDQSKLLSVSADKKHLMNAVAEEICLVISADPLNLQKIYQQAAVICQKHAETIKKEGTLQDMLNAMSDKYKKLAELNAPAAGVKAKAESVSTNKVPAQPTKLRRSSSGD